MIVVFLLEVEIDAQRGQETHLEFHSCSRRTQNPDSGPNYCVTTPNSHRTIQDWKQSPLSWKEPFPSWGTLLAPASVMYTDGVALAWAEPGWGKGLGKEITETQELPFHLHWAFVLPCEFKLAVSPITSPQYPHLWNEGIESDVLWGPFQSQEF